MIGALKGTLLTKTNPTIIMIAGVGYKVVVTQNFLHTHKENDDVFLFIHTHIRDDAFDLYGFITNEELFLFELLLSVSGVGPKIAVAILDRGVFGITKAVADADIDFFMTVPRLGKKNAQKIIIELKNKLGSNKDLNLTDSYSSETKDLLDGLISLGFTKHDCQNILEKIPDTIEKQEEKIRYALRLLGKNHS